MGDITIRLLGPEDLLDVCKLWKEAGLPYKPQGRDSLGVMNKEMKETKNFLAGAFLGQALVGAVLGTDDGRKGWINRLAVKPAYRRKGVAKKLVTFCTRVFQGRGIGIVCALVEEENAASLKLFGEEGFELRKDILYLRKMVRGEEW